MLSKEIKFCNISCFIENTASAIDDIQMIYWQNMFLVIINVLYVSICYVWQF